MESGMKVDGISRHASVAASTAARYPKLTLSFREALGEDASIASSQHAISFDGAGLLGVNRSDGIGADSTPPTRADVLRTETSTPPAFAIELAQGEASSRPIAASASMDGINASRLDLRNPARQRRGLDVSVANVAAANWSIVDATRITLDSAAASPTGGAPSLQPSVLAKTNDALVTEVRETSENGSVEQSDSAAPALEEDGASEVVSVTVSDDDGDVRIVAAVPDLSDEARQQVRRAAEDIARATGVSISGFSLNGAALIHNKEPDRRISWRSHL
jgi:hypothetical protein